MTNRAKILNYMEKRGFITKAIAAGYFWSFGLSEHISQLRKKHNIETVMVKKGKTSYARFVYKGAK